MASSNSNPAPSTDCKQLVADGYNKMAAEYTAWAVTGSHTRMQYVNELLSHLPDAVNSTVLELGCGAGTPVLEHLVRKVAHVYANDISSVQLDFARARCPERTTFLPGDMTTLEIGAGSLDAAVAFYSILHLPRDEQAAMFRQLRRWLKDGGLLALNLATEDEEEMRGKFFGVEMVWSGYPPETSKKIIEEAGFELVKAEVKTGEDLPEEDPDHGITFLWILAMKSAELSA